MARIALFHSVLGVRPGVLDAADQLSAAGHTVELVDQYGGRVFDDYDEASEFALGIGYGRLMQAAIDAVRDLPDGFIAAGFSNGGGMAEHVAGVRSVSGVLMLSGAAGLDLVGLSEWPHGVPAQIHYTRDDPFRQQASIDSVRAAMRVADATLECFEYPGAGHLFTDRTLPDEHDAASAELLWRRVLAFCAEPGRVQQGA